VAAAHQQDRAAGDGTPAAPAAAAARNGHQVLTGMSLQEGNTAVVTHDRLCRLREIMATMEAGGATITNLIPLLHLLLTEMTEAGIETTEEAGIETTEEAGIETIAEGGIVMIAAGTVMTGVVIRVVAVIAAAATDLKGIGHPAQEPDLRGGTEAVARVEITAGAGVTMRRS